MKFKITKDQMILIFVIFVGLVSVQVYFKRGLSSRVHVTNYEEFNPLSNHELINSNK